MNNSHFQIYINYSYLKFDPKKGKFGLEED